MTNNAETQSSSPATSPKLITFDRTPETYRHWKLKFCSATQPS